ncbi:MAG: hypothetical protein A3G24_25135 [Betaproteobacteria bacterium RIFCSPLOWO2_12_FULL_62_13]|nr:MAG: hypothetical protein A3G24_25135 [Betaproteobacteria bacterium RIFCSPLOWO2_12_FULL_62_13]
MVRKHGFFLSLALLMLGGAAAMRGDFEHEVNLSSVLELWGDVLRDADQFGLKLTRVSEQEEMRLGKELVNVAKGWGRETPASAQYVSAVGQALQPHVKRKGIQYQFHVIEADGVVNAFALPGGQIFFTTGMLNFLQSEAELAAILGHEISHVDLGHCIERFQLELAFKKVGAGGIGQLAEIARSLVALEYNKYQELEADAHGIRLSVDAGYDPGAGAAVFERMKRHFGERTAGKAKTPIGEVTHALGDALVSYFQSHPPSADREQRLKSLVARNRERLAGRALYVGVENYRQKIPRSQQEFPGERRGP